MRIKDLGEWNFLFTNVSILYNYCLSKYLVLFINTIFNFKILIIRRIR